MPGSGTLEGVIFGIGCRGYGGIGMRLVCVCFWSRFPRGPSI